MLSGLVCGVIKKAREILLITDFKTQGRWFVRQLRPLLPAYFLSVVLVVLSSLMFLLDPLLMKWLIDRVLPKKDFRLLLLQPRDFSDCTSSGWASLRCPKS